jgi:hypothetical protein
MTTITRNAGRFHAPIDNELKRRKWREQDLDFSAFLQDEVDENLFVVESVAHKSIRRLIKKSDDDGAEIRRRLRRDFRLVRLMDGMGEDPDQRLQEQADFHHLGEWGRHHLFLDRKLFLEIQYACKSIGFETDEIEMVNC